MGRIASNTSVDKEVGQMLDSFLARAVDIDDLTDPDYSEIVGRVLHSIYRRLAATRFDGLLMRLGPLLMQPMGSHQRARVRYLLGMTTLHAGHVQVAVEHFEHALALAQLLDDPAAFAEVALQLAHVHHMHYSMRGARHYAVQARDAFRAIDQLDVTAADEVSPAAVEFGLSLLWELASHAFYLGEYWTSLGYVAEGRMLARRSRKHHRREASLAWAAALSYHWLQHPLTALDQARQALSLYDEHGFGSPEERARMGVFFAEVALGAALHLSSPDDDLEGTTAYRLYEEGGSRLKEARAALIRCEDTLGIARAHLVQARHNRLGEVPSDRYTLYDDLESLGIIKEDQPLLCQIWTERADDLLSLGQPSLAHASYGRAIESLGTSEALAMGAWAWHGLEHAQP